MYNPAIAGDDFLPTLSTKSQVALPLPDGLTLDEWQQVGERLSSVRTSIQFWLGDWWNYGHARYEHSRPYEIASRVGLNYRTIENYASVCRAIESSRRRELLKFGHHAAVAALPAAEGDALLDWCEERLKVEGRAPSVHELQREVETRRVTRAAALAKHLQVTREVTTPRTIQLHVSECAQNNSAQIIPLHRPPPEPRPSLSIIPAVAGPPYHLSLPRSPSNHRRP